MDALLQDNKMDLDMHFHVMDFVVMRQIHKFILVSQILLIQYLFRMKYNKQPFLTAAFRAGNLEFVSRNENNNKNKHEYKEDG